MIRAVIIDDEDKSRETLADMIKEFCEGIEVIGEAGNLTDAVRIIKEKKPDLAFLDINMPNGSGFDLLRSLPRVNFEVVFVTAYDEFAVQAVRFSAMDYLLKPVNLAELKDCIRRAELKLAEKDSENHLHHLVENLEQSFNPASKIAVPMRDGFRFIPLHKIVRLEADGSYTHIFTDDGQNIVSTRYLKDYEDILPDKLFLRVHNSHIINMEHVVYYQRGEGGIVTLSDKSEISVAKRRKKDLLDKFIS